MVVSCWCWRKVLVVLEGVGINFRPVNLVISSGKLCLGLKQSLVLLGHSGLNLSWQSCHSSSVCLFAPPPVLWCGRSVDWKQGSLDMPVYIAEW